MEKCENLENGKNGKLKNGTFWENGKHGKLKNGRN